MASVCIALYFHQISSRTGQFRALDNSCFGVFLLCVSSQNSVQLGSSSLNSSCKIAARIPVLEEFGKLGQVLVFRHANTLP